MMHFHENMAIDLSITKMIHLTNRYDFATDSVLKISFMENSTLNLKSVSMEKIL